MKRNAIETLSYSGIGTAHSHSHTQIVIPISGSLELEIGGKQSLIANGRAALISQAQKHTHEAIFDNECIVINDIPTWDKNIETNSMFIDINEETIQLLPFLKTLTSNYKKNALILDSALSLIGELLPIPQANVSRKELLFNKAKSILDDTPTIKIATLANQLHVSQSTLHSIFIKYANATPKQAQQQLLANKIEQNLAKHPHQTLEEIAFNLSLPDAPSLARIYKRVKKFSPKAKQNHFK